MFDLNRELRRWRKAMSAGRALGRDDVDELQSHLCDAVELHQRAGATAEEAWRAALVELGAPERVKSEFVKLPRTWSRIMKPKNVDALSLQLLAAAVVCAAVLSPALVRFGLAPLTLYLSTSALLTRAVVECLRPGEQWLRGLLWMFALLVGYGFILPFWAKMHFVHGNAYPALPIVDGGAVLLNAVVALGRPFVSRLLLHFSGRPA